MDGNVNPFDWYWSIPIVTRTALTLCLMVTLSCAFDVGVAPIHLYYNHHSIYAEGEIWRLLTNFLYFGKLGFSLIFHMYFLTRYSRSLEEGRLFRGKPADYSAFLLFCMISFMSIAPYLDLPFYGSSLTFAITYLWARRNPELQVAMMGLVTFSAAYLPWVFGAMSLAMDQDITQDLLGLAVGHTYYFLNDVWPVLAIRRGWYLKAIFPNPSSIRKLFNNILDKFRANNNNPVIVVGNDPLRNN